jgi:hypothetical protein
VVTAYGGVDIEMGSSMTLRTLENGPPSATFRI